MRSGCVEEAEKNGYILVGAMGYNPSSPFGATMGGRGPGRRGPGARSDANTVGRGVGANAAAPGGRGRFGGRGPTVGGTKETDPARTSALSEKDTMNVLEM